MPASKAAKKATKKTASKKAKQVDSPVEEISDEQIAEDVITLDRRSEDRRAGDPEALDVGVMKSPRRKKQRRRHIDPTTCERDYNDQEIEFMRAMDDYKRDSGRMFPTCSEVLEVIRDLGYVQLSDEQATVLQLENADTESTAHEDVETEEADLKAALEN